MVRHEHMTYPGCSTPQPHDAADKLENCVAVGCMHQSASQHPSHLPSYAGVTGVGDGVQELSLETSIDQHEQPANTGRLQCFFQGS